MEIKNSEKTVSKPICLNRFELVFILLAKAIAIWVANSIIEFGELSIKKPFAEFSFML